VRDTDKLLKALNNVTFRQFRVWAKVACFDRKPLGVGGKTVSEGIRDEDVMRNGVEKKAEPMGERGKIEVAIAEGEKSEPVGKKER